MSSQTLPIELDRLRSDADAEFIRGDWESAANKYRLIAEEINRIWIFDVEPDSNALKEGFGVAQRHAFSLARLGRAEDALMVLEFGIAKYLNRLINIDEIRLFDDDDNALSYLAAVRSLLTEQARRSHPNQADRIFDGSIFTLTKLLTSMKEADAIEYNRLQNEIRELSSTKEGHEQFMYVFGSVLLGEKPIVKHDANILDKFLNAFTAMREISQKYDVGKPPDVHARNADLAREEIQRCAPLLSLDFMRPNLKDIDCAIGLDSANPAEKTIIVYIAATEHGLVYLFAKQEDNRRKILARFNNQITEKEIYSIQSLFLGEDNLFGTDFWGRPNLAALLVHLWPIVLPILEEVTSDPHSVIAIVPTGMLANLPLHAAKSSRGRRALSFGEQVTLTYVSSARALGKSKRDAKIFERDPLYTCSIVDPLPTRQRKLSTARSEVDFVACRFIQGSQQMWMLPRIWDGESASRMFAMGPVGGSTVLHVACHAFFDKLSPLLSGIYLSNDEIWSAADTLRKNNKLRLTILSCCSSGEASIEASNEALSLPNLMVANGSAGVIATLWSIYDVCSTILVIRIFDFMLDYDQSPPAALSRATAWLLRTNKKRVRDYVYSLQFRVEDEWPLDIRSGLHDGWKNLMEHVDSIGARDWHRKCTITAAAFFMTGI